MRPLAAIVVFAAVAATAGPGARADLSPAPAADAIFSHAKAAWHARGEAPFVSFNLRESYDWRGKTHENWWHVAYRDRDRALALRRIIVAGDERERLKGTAIGLNLRLHDSTARADSLDTNAAADAFPLLDPQIEPNASFGLVRREPRAELTGAAPASEAAAAASPATRPTPATEAQLAPSPAPAVPASFATEKPLREVARVEAVARDYTIALLGTERVRGIVAYHLTLVPLREPRLYRLRDLWVDTATYATVQLAVQGLFEGKPYEDARWTIGYVPIDGRSYVQQIRTDDALRFGLDRIVTGMQFDFVAYDFPATIPAIAFDRLL